MKMTDTQKKDARIAAAMVLSNHPSAINVLQKHIDAGERQSCTRCAVALAMQDATGIEWTVGYRIATAHGGDSMILLPTLVEDRIREIDRGHGAPFSFEIPIEMLRRQGP